MSTVELLKVERERDEAKAEAAEVELSKRKIGREGAMPAPEPGPPHRDVDASDFRLASALLTVEKGIERLEASGEDPAQLAKNRAIKRELETELFHLHHPEQAAARDEGLLNKAETPAGLTTALSKAETLQEYDPELSSAEAFRRAAQDPEVQKAYLVENGITAPVRPKPAGLAKGETGPAQADVDAVGRRADLLEKSENLSPTVAYRQAVRELAAA